MNYSPDVQKGIISKNTLKTLMKGHFKSQTVLYIRQPQNDTSCQYPIRSGYRINQTLRTLNE